MLGWFSRPFPWHVTQQGQGQDLNVYGIIPMVCKQGQETQSYTKAIYGANQWSTGTIEYILQEIVGFWGCMTLWICFLDFYSLFL